MQCDIVALSQQFSKSKLLGLSSSYTTYHNRVQTMPTSCYD